jgi:hypothetical protein
MTTEVRTHWLVTIGLIGLVVGVIDPLEGSVVILVASGLVALGTHRMRSPHRLLGAWGFVLVFLGFAAIWTITAFGGVGGSTGHSAWWAILVAPYVVGWALGVVAGVRTLMEHLRGRRSNDPPEGPETQRPEPRLSSADRPR